MKHLIGWAPPALALAGLGVTGCAGSETGNGEVEHREVAVVMELAADGATLAATDKAGTTFTIDSADVLVEEIDLWLPVGEPCSDRVPVPTLTDAPPAPYVPICTADDTKLRVLGPWHVDLVTGVLEPSLASLDLPDGTYVRVGARMRPALPGEADVHAADALDHQTIDVTGRVTLGGAEARWDLRLDFTDEARFEPASPIEIGPGVSSIFLLLDVETWFAKLDLAACMTAGEVPKDADGTYELAELAPRCGNIENAIRTAIRDAGRAESR